MNDLSLKYASALYEIGLEENSLDKYQEECRVILNSINDNEEILEVLESAFLSNDEKLSTVDSIFKNVSNDVVSLIKIIVSNHRVDILKDVLMSFNSLVNQNKGITEGLLYSAFPLDKGTFKEIEKALSKKENREVSLIEKVDPSLIGGIKIVINNRVYDGSVKSKLASLCV